MGIFESLLDAGWVKDQVMNNPFEFWTFTVIVATASFLLGWKLRGWWPSPIERADIDAIVATDEATQANERAEAAERRVAELESMLAPLERAKGRVAALPSPQWSLLAALFERGRTFTPELNEVADGAYLALSALEEVGLVSHDFDPGNGTSWALTPLGFDAVAWRLGAMD